MKVYNFQRVNLFFFKQGFFKGYSYILGHVVFRGA